MRHDWVLLSGAAICRIQGLMLARYKSDILEFPSKSWQVRRGFWALKKDRGDEAELWLGI